MGLGFGPAMAGAPEGTPYTRYTCMSTNEDGFEFFEQKYTESRERAARRLEETALGQSVGLNGYTTVAEAQTLAEHLQLSATSTLLDVGAGRGWPGSHVTRTSGCRLVSADRPWDALLAARTRGGTDVVAAVGGALPFPGDTFDGIVHADVFC